MVTTTRIKHGLNALLRPLNIKIDSWTVSDRERARIESLRARGKLNEPVYPLTGGMERFDPSLIESAYADHREALSCLASPKANGTGYDPVNSYFAPPDAEVLYLLMRALKPKRVVEVGCGNSTRVTRQAIKDGELGTQLIAIDPYPRIDIEGLVDRFVQGKLEEMTDWSIFESLEKDDILFIDSSHQAAVGNDVAYLFCKIIPALKPGVVVHVHDIFLPYDYPPNFAVDYPDWGEQYVLHAMVNGRDCEVLWPGHHVQRDRIDLHERLPFVKSGISQSFWFRWS